MCLTHKYIIAHIPGLVETSRKSDGFNYFYGPKLYILVIDWLIGV